jgi:hypothetical protein
MTGEISWCNVHYRKVETYINFGDAMHAEATNKASEATRQISAPIQVSSGIFSQHDTRHKPPTSCLHLVV